MGLEDRIKEEMYVDAESLLEDEFERAKQLFDIYEDDTVSLADDVADLDPPERILTRLVAQQYIAEANDAEGPSLFYDYFYERIDRDDSTIRKYFGALVNDGLVVRGEDQGEHELVVERLADVLERIETALESDET
ncbi:hypothetical protein ACM16X_21010 [Haloarcula japonica]|uniref:hypothetical protein n=1 Tax=Haloarcula japonica TaxID=29282 RepID=UPI0039F65D91